MALPCACGAIAAGSDSAFLQLFPLTGELRLRNKAATAFEFIFYEINSPSGSLNSSPSVWKSISDFYDVSGNGQVDPVNNWTKLTPPGSTTELSEGVVPNPGGRLLPMRAISLGNVWNPNALPTPDLTIEVHHPNEDQADVTIEFALDGDYFADGVVNDTDYNLWRQFYGSTSVLLADGDLNGVVDTADYIVWRNNRGNMLPAGLSIGPVSGGGSSLVAAVVPEPASALLLVAGAAAWMLLAKRLRAR